MNENEVPSFAVGTKGPRQGYNRDRWIETPVNMGSGYLTNTASTLYTAPSGSIAGAASQKAVLLDIWLCNTDTATRTVTLYINGSSDDKCIYKDFSMTTKTSVRQECYIVLESGQTIQGLADVTSKVSVRLSGKALT